MSADYIVENPQNKSIKICCWICKKQITDLNNISIGHEKCIRDNTLRIDIDFEDNTSYRYSKQLLQEYRDIRKVGFIGTMQDYIFYKNNYGKDRKEIVQEEFKDEDIPF